jgi:hypothetical protein
MEDLDRKATLRTAAPPSAPSENMHEKLRRVPVDADGCAHNTQQHTAYNMQGAACAIHHTRYETDTKPAACNVLSIQHTTAVVPNVIATLCSGQARDIVDRHAGAPPTTV